MLECSDQVFIEKLVLDMSIGIYDFEKQNTQQVLVDIYIDVLTPKTPVEDINTVVSYEEIVNKVQALSKQKHYDLVETFAEEISKLCLSYAAVNQVKVRVKKPDIIENTQSVGVQIIRNKS